MPTTLPSELPDVREGGFGMIEIVISMFLIGILAIAFLPLLLQMVMISATNATRATATQVVAQQLERVGALGSSCSAVKEFAAVTPAVVTDPRGELQPHLNLESFVCAEPYAPRVVLLSISVTKVGSTNEIAAAKTLILLDAP